MNTAFLNHRPVLAGLTLAEAPSPATPTEVRLPAGARPASTRATEVALAVTEAGLDAAFHNLVSEADAARDRRQWDIAEYLYWRALSLHPLHPGYRVQYGHALKEQGKLADAEVAYRSAWALGGQGEDLQRHIMHVAGLQGDATAPPLPPEAPPAHPLDELPWREDVELAYALLLHRPPQLIGEVLPLLRAAPSRRAMLLLIAERPEMAAANRDLMLLLAEAG
jgi:hypothetical protein